MTPAHLKAAIGIIATVAAPILTYVVLRFDLPDGAHEAGVVLATLAWQQAMHITRNLFPAPESDKGAGQ
jgi:hypothetical protein